MLLIESFHHFILYLVHMSDPRRTVDATLPSSNNGSGTCDAQIHPSPQKLSSANAGM